VRISRIPPSLPSAQEIRFAVDSFVRWLDAYGPRSQDIMDLWAFSLGRRAKAAYHRHPLMGRAAVAPLVALDVLAPGVRRLVRPPVRFPIADAHYALAFTALARLDADERHLVRARTHLDALRNSRSRRFPEWCWGFPFTWETAVGTWEAGRPLITQTPYAYDAFAAADELISAAERDAILGSVGTFAFKRIPSRGTGAGNSVASYSPFDSRQVVNANAYRGALLLDAGRRFNRLDWIDEGERNIGFVLECQRDDGSWPYAVDGLDQFVDNFHTCFVLKNLVKSRRLGVRQDVLDALVRGYGYYKRALLDEHLQPVPFAVGRRVSLHKRDLYDYAEGIVLALEMRELDQDALVVLASLTGALVRHWRLPDGHFVTRTTGFGRNKVPYHRWAQSQAFHALVHVLAVRDEIGL
jgi:hypothetical protein